MDTENEKQPVPLIIHQTAPDDQQRWDPRWHHCRDTWKMTCPEPEYRHMFWNDAGLRALVAEAFPEHLQTYDNYKEHIQRVDFARAAMLYIYGGLYADMDVEARASPFPYLPAGLVSIVESPYPENEKHQNSMMASPPKHPFWHKLAKEAAHRRSAGNRDRFRTTWQLTGPQLLDAVVAQNSKDVHVLPCQDFNPGMNSPFFNSERVFTRHFCTSVWTHTMDTSAMLLYQSARCSNYEGAKAAIAAGADLKCHDHAGLTPLHHAAVRGDAEMISLLVHSKAQADSGDTNNTTALHYAVQAQKIEAVRALLKVGASLSVQLRDGLYAGATAVQLAGFLHSRSSSQIAKDITCLLNSALASSEASEDTLTTVREASSIPGQVASYAKAEMRCARGRNYCCASDWHDRSLNKKSNAISAEPAAIGLARSRARFAHCGRVWGRRNARQWREIVCVD